MLSITYQFDTELKLPKESNFFRGIWMPYFGPFMFESVQSIRGVHRSFPKTMSSITSRLHGMNCVHLYLKNNYSIIGMFLFLCMKDIFSLISLGQCEMKLSQIRTADGKEYRIPDTKDCEVVMAMDCSSSKQFAVKTKRDSSDSSKQVSQQYILIFFFFGGCNPMLNIKLL